VLPLRSIPGWMVRSEHLIDPFQYNNLPLQIIPNRSAYKTKREDEVDRKGSYLAFGHI
jgi:hypothetical protein